jgi:hypothetical protein
VFNLEQTPGATGIRLEEMRGGFRVEFNDEEDRIMADPKRGQDTSDKSGREMDRQGTQGDTERQVDRNPEPHRKGDTGKSQEGRKV